MLARNRLLLYQVFASFIATGYTLLNPPRCVEEHLRSLEAVGNLVLYYFVLGGYACLVFSFFHWGAFCLATPYIAGLFRTLLKTLNVPLLRYALDEYLNSQSNWQYQRHLIETMLDWELRDAHHMRTIAALQQQNDSFNIHFDTAYAKHRDALSVLRNHKVDAHWHEATTKVLRTRLEEQQALVKARNVRLVEIETDTANLHTHVAELRTQLESARAVGVKHETSATEWQARALESEAKVKKLEATLERKRRDRNAWEVRALTSAEKARELHELASHNAKVAREYCERIARQEELNCKAADKISAYRHRTHEAEAKVNVLEMHILELESRDQECRARADSAEAKAERLSLELDEWTDRAHQFENTATEWKASSDMQEAKAYDLENHNVKLEAIVMDLQGDVMDLETRVTGFDAKVADWMSQAAHHEEDAAEWKIRATEEGHKASRLNASNLTLQAMISDFEAKIESLNHNVTEDDNKASRLNANNLALQATIADCEIKIESLNNDVTELAIKANGWESEAHNCAKEAVQQKNWGTDQQVRADVLEHRKHELEAEVSDLKSGVVVHELRALALSAEVDEIKAISRNHENAAVEWKARATEQHARADDLEARTGELQSALGNVTACLTERDTLVATLMLRSSELEACLGDADALSLELDALVSEWKTRAQASKKVADERKTRVTELEAEVEGLNARLTTLECTEVGLEWCANEAETSAAEWEARAESQAAKVIDLEGRISDLEEKVTSSELDALESKEDTDNWKTRAHAHEFKVDSLDRRVAELISDIAARDTLIRDLEAAVRDRDATIVGTELAADEWKASALVSDAKVVHAEERVRDAAIAVHQAEIDLTASHQVLAVFIDRFRQGRDIIAKLTCRDTGVSQKDEEVKSRVTALDKDAHKSQAEVVRTQAALDAQQKVNIALEAEVAAFSKERRSLDTKLAASEAQGKGVQDQLSEVKKELAAEKDGRTRLSSEAESLSHHLNSAQRELLASTTQTEGVKAELTRTAKELEAQKKANVELAKSRDTLQDKQVATPVRVQSLRKTTSTSASPLPNVTPGKGRNVPASKPATPTSVAKSTLTRTAGLRENQNIVNTEAKKANDTLKAELASSEKVNEVLKSQLSTSEERVDGLQAQLATTVGAVDDIKAKLAEAETAWATHECDGETVAAQELVQATEKELTDAKVRLGDSEATVVRLSQRVANVELERAMHKCQLPASEDKTTEENAQDVVTFQGLIVALAHLRKQCKAEAEAKAKLVADQTTTRTLCKVAHYALDYSDEQVHAIRTEKAAVYRQMQLERYELDAKESKVDELTAENHELKWALMKVEQYFEIMYNSEDEFDSMEADEGDSGQAIDDSDSREELSHNTDEATEDGTEEVVILQAIQPVESSSTTA